MKTLFWNVDTQYDFIEDKEYKGTLAIPESILIRPNLKLLTSYAREKEIQLVNTADWHNEESKEISDNPDFVKTFPRHCMIGSYGARFIQETAPEDPYKLDWRRVRFDKRKITRTRNLVLYKDAFNVFEGSPYTEKVLKLIEPNKIVVYGVATDVCVKEAVFGLQERDYQCCLVYDAIKGVKPSTTSEAIEDMACSGAKLLSTKDVLEGRI
jgi:nicotinamidase/pyrazinamidase